MYSVLMVAALAVGSGDVRGGATDERAVNLAAPYDRLRVGISVDEVYRLLGHDLLWRAYGNTRKKSWVATWPVLHGWVVDTPGIELYFEYDALVRWVILR